VITFRTYDSHSIHYFFTSGNIFQWETWSSNCRGFQSGQLFAGENHDERSFFLVILSKLNFQRR
jgi:hypothetical protein